MTEPRRLQSVLAQSLHRYCQDHTLNPRQWQVCHHVLACRTEALGETQLECERCGKQSRFYHACRDRHCPRCQRRASEQWCQRQSAQTLDVVYYHVVFTLPHALNPWAEIHPEVIYDQLLKSAWATLASFAADKKRLDGQLGATLVLHTWGQTLVRHLHVHCLVPGGALTEAGIWKAARSTYLFPVRALSRYFRGHFVHSLRERHREGELPRIEDARSLKRMLDELMETDWAVYTKPCLQHTESVVRYLARYSHRIGLSDSRLLDSEDGQVRLRYTDYRDHGRRKVLALCDEELIRRYLLYVLPKSFMRIRHYGFLANRCRTTKLTQIREAIGQAAKREQEAESAGGEPDNGHRCPHCATGRLRVVAIVPAPRWQIRSLPPPSVADRVH